MDVDGSYPIVPPGPPGDWLANGSAVGDDER